MDSIFIAMFHNKSTTWICFYKCDPSNWLYFSLVFLHSVKVKVLVYLFVYNVFQLSCSVDFSNLTLIPEMLEIFNFIQF